MQETYEIVLKIRRYDPDNKGSYRFDGTPKVFKSSRALRGVGCEPEARANLNRTTFFGVLVAKMFFHKM